MSLILISPKKNASLYAVKIFTGSVMLWYGLRACGIAEPYWALISLIIVTEPDIAQAKANFSARTINTLTGTLSAGLLLVSMGPSFISLLLSMLLALLVAMLAHNYPANWRLAPATSVIIMSATFGGGGLHQELHFALLRVIEVLTGSAVALLQSLVYATLVEKFIHKSGANRTTA
ncbi:MAG: FUSC family protein [Stenotrophobium sp.]